MVDVSRNVVAALLLLVMVVSGVSTYYALWGQERPVPEVRGQKGEVRLEIAQDEGFVQSQALTTGQVVLHIQRPEAS